MSSILLHVAAIDRLRKRPRGLPAAMRRGLLDDLPYARFGAVLPHLPRFAEVEGCRWLLGLRAAPGPALRANSDATLAFGFKMAELTGNGALVGTEAGMAAVTGFFVHVCIERALRPLNDALIARHRDVAEPPAQAASRIDWVQGVAFMEELYGTRLVGSTAILGKLQVSKRGGFARGLGRGLYELVRLSAEEAWSESPTKADIDRWLKSAGRCGWVLASPLGWARASVARSALVRRDLYQGADIDVPAVVEEALDRTCEVLTVLYDLIERGRFDRRGRARFLSAFAGS